MFYFYSKILKKLTGSAIKNSYIDKRAKIEAGTSFVSSNIDKYSFCGYDCFFLNCEVGSFCSIGSRVIVGGVAHPLHFVSTSPVFLSHKDSIKKKFAKFDYLPQIKTIIGHDVWIGDGVYIKPGVIIGSGAVIGMGSVVTKDIPPYAIYAGNPASLIRMRFEKDIIKALINMKWWSLPENKLTELAKYFNDPNKLLRAIGYFL